MLPKFRIFVFSTLATLIVLFGSARLFFFLTDGLTEDNITSEFSYRSDWQHPIVTPEEEEIALKILDQNFYYFDRGAQAYAFISEDGHYVLKIIKQKHLKLKGWEDLLLSLPFTDNWRAKKLLKRKDKVEKMLRSSKISFEELKEETALMYMHLNPTTHLQKKICFFDKMGFSHTISLDKTEFCLQKRAVLALPYLASLIEQGNIKKAMEAIDKILSLHVEISKREILDQDPGRFLNNLAFIDHNPVIIDIGEFTKNDKIKQCKNYTKDLTHKTEGLRNWLQTHCPPLLQHIQGRLDHLASLDQNSL